MKSDKRCRRDRRRDEDRQTGVGRMWRKREEDKNGGMINWERKSGWTGGYGRQNKVWMKGVIMKGRMGGEKK